jgi:hypothetical protein
MRRVPVKVLCLFDLIVFSPVVVYEKIYRDAEEYATTHEPLLPKRSRSYLCIIAIISKLN